MLSVRTTSSGRRDSAAPSCISTCASTRSASTLKPLQSSTGSGSGSGGASNVILRWVLAQTRMGATTEPISESTLNASTILPFCSAESSSRWSSWKAGTTKEERLACCTRASHTAWTPRSRTISSRHAARSGALERVASSSAITPSFCSSASANFLPMFRTIAATLRTSTTARTGLCAATCAKTAATRVTSSRPPPRCQK
mmetsp:Transcript_3172/g.7822  ORF Transcript_3172/g.7822 Transcript_3172/m.7822 type:complete len:200 (-) Transcript_3172:251-850(-)